MIPGEENGPATGQEQDPQKDNKDSISAQSVAEDPDQPDIYEPAARKKAGAEGDDI